MCLCRVFLLFFPSWTWSAFHCPVSLAPGTSLGWRSAACAMCSVRSPISQLQIGANVAIKAVIDSRPRLCSQPLHGCSGLGFCSLILCFVRASWQHQQCKVIFVNLFLIKKVSLWPEGDNTKLCFFSWIQPHLNVWKYFQSVVCSLIISFKNPV